MKRDVKAVVILNGLLLGFSLSSPIFGQSVANILPNIKNEALAVHNKWRALHHAPQLSWDMELQRYAELYASLCDFKHSNPPFGENLAAGYVSVTAAVNAWYAEGELYSYRHPGYSKPTGHFTQVVWVGTQKLGCGYAVCNGKNGTPGNYLVCEYSPAGNITNPGYFEKNVLAPKSGWFSQAILSS